MEPSAQNWTVISLGGSLICPDKVDAVYVTAFVVFVRSRVLKGESIAIITGGGKLCREYNDALRMAATPTNEDLDWLGIYTTRYNAELIRLALKDVEDHVLVTGGTKPGHSSDGAAVELAEKLGAKKLINLSNIDYVYTADPRKDSTATKIEKIAWPEFRKLLPKEWDPGASAPFDPVAAQMAEDIGLEVAVMNGKNLENLAAYLDGKEFQGTVIS
jgi:uridylate kinase